MTSPCTLQLHAAGAWCDVASVSLLGAEEEGWKAKTYTGFTVDWAFAYLGATDAHAACAGWPVFLIALLPQGFGRQQLLRRIGLSPTAGVVAD